MAQLKIQTRDIEMNIEGDVKSIGFEPVIGCNAAISREGEKILVKVHEKTKQVAEDAKNCDKKDTTEVIAELPTVCEGIKDEVVAIYDNAGIPSFMHRFTKVTNKELFGGGNKTHAAFIIDGIEYDEIFVSVYPNCNIGGKAYSLPYMKPWTDLTLEEAEQACFSKGEGWHLMTAAEWGLLANISLKNGTLPHGNTNYGKYHADESEKGVLAPKSSCITLTGSGPATWTHDHTPTGVHDLCGNVLEFVRGLRFYNGRVQTCYDNDGALPIDLSENGDGWHDMLEPEDGTPIFVDAQDGVRFTTNGDESGSYDGCRWDNVKSDFGFTEQMKELALYNGEPQAWCYIDGSEGEYIASRGGGWADSSGDGVFCLFGLFARSYAGSYFGFRSAYFKRKTAN